MAPPSRVAAAVWVAKCKYFEEGTQVWFLRTDNSLNAKGGGAKFEQVKATFNADSFICRLSQSISSDFGAVRSWNVCRSPKSPKIHKNPYFGVQDHLKSLLSVAIKNQYIGLPITD